MIKRFVLYSFAVLALVVSGCKKDKEEDTNGNPVVTLDATDITYCSVVLNGRVDPDVLKNSNEMGFFVSKSDNPESSGTKFVTSTINAENKFSAQVKDLDEETTYYYVAFMAVGPANYLGKTKSFTTAKVEDSGVDAGPIKQGRWDAYIDDKLEYALVFSKGKNADWYRFSLGERMSGPYTFENDRLTIGTHTVENGESKIDDVSWFWAPGDYETTNDYEWINPDTLEPYNAGNWYTMENDPVYIEHLIRLYGWWLDREFILDSPTTAHGKGGDVDGKELNIVYKYREE